MENKKKSLVALSLLFGATFVADAASLDPAINESTRIDLNSGMEFAKIENNNNNNNNFQMDAAAKPDVLLQFDAALSVS
jgi:hypothetical protein